MSDLGFPANRFSWESREGFAPFPNGAKMAVLIYTAPEQWNWSEGEPLHQPGTLPLGEKVPSLSSRSAVQYGFNVGLRRMQEVFDKHNMKVTLWTSGQAVEQFPEVMRDLVNDGHELGAHGYSQGWPMQLMDRQQQQEAIKKSIDVLGSFTGQAPRGWIGPGAGATHETIELLAEAGFEYNSDMQDDELPYFLHAGDKTMVEIPYRMVGNLNDFLILSAGFGIPKSIPEAITHLTSAFDAYHRASQSRPLLFNYGTHPYVSGRPDNIYVLDAFIQHVKQHKDVWVCSYGEINDWWRKQYLDLANPAGGSIDAPQSAR